MHVLLINQFYPPDLAPTGQLLRDLAETLALRRHEVTVLCSAQTYAADGAVPGAVGERLRVVRVGRAGAARRGFGGTLARQLAFQAAAYGWLRRARPRPAVVVALTSPPWIGLTAQRALGRGPRHVQWAMDLYPEALVAGGLLRRGGLPARFLAALTRRQWRDTALVVAPGPGMARQIEAGIGAGPRPKVVTVPLWASEDLRPWPAAVPNPLRRARGWGEAETVYLYSGNLGLGHCVAPFLRAALRLRDVPGLRWAFAGQGRRRPEVEAFRRAHPDVRLELLPYAAPADLCAHLGSGDVHLASLKAEWASVMAPSKLQAAFAVGRPVLLVAPLSSDPAGWVRDSGGGWVAEEHDDEGLARLVRESCDPAERARRGLAARSFADREFGVANGGRMADLIEAAVASA